MRSTAALLKPLLKPLREPLRELRDRSEGLALRATNFSSRTSRYRDSQFFAQFCTAPCRHTRVWLLQGPRFRDYGFTDSSKCAFLKACVVLCTQQQADQKQKNSNTLAQLQAGKWALKEHAVSLRLLCTPYSLRFALL